MDRKRFLYGIIIMTAVVIIAGLVAPLRAEQLRPAGFLGNSGASGRSLVRVDPEGLHNTGSGVAAASDRTLWYGAGRRINHMTFTGTLIESFPLKPEGSRVETQTFTLADNRLYFIGRMPDNGPRVLFVLPVDGSSPAAVPVTGALPQKPDDPFFVAAQPLDGKLVMLVLNPSVKELTVWFFDPKSNALTRAFSIPGIWSTGLAVDRIHRVIYIGGRIIPSNDPNVEFSLGITAVTPEGKTISSEFPAACLKLPMQPVYFLGHVNVAGGALWDLAWYGFLARLDLNAQIAPGVVELWQHELGWISQIIDMGDGEGQETDVLACASAGDEALYIGNWKSSLRKFQLVRRIGCLPVIVSLWLTPDGWVSAGTSRTQAWWRFDEGADEPPRKTDIDVALTPAVVQRGSECLAMASLYGLANVTGSRPIAAAFSWEPTLDNEARRLTEPIPVKKPVGMAAENPSGDGYGRLFLSDADTRKIWQTRVYRPGLTPDNTQWKPLAYADPSLEKTLETVTDVACLSDNTLLVSVDGALIQLKEGKTGYEMTRRFEKWGDNPESCFGRRLRFCLSGDRLLVSDSDRHRILLFDVATWTLLAQAGDTDKPGDQPGRFNNPTLAAMSNGRAVVADAGNQRIAKFIISP